MKKPIWSAQSRLLTLSLLLKLSTYHALQKSTNYLSNELPPVSEMLNCDILHLALHLVSSVIITCRQVMYLCVCVFKSRIIHVCCQ